MRQRPLLLRRRRSRQCRHSKRGCLLRCRSRRCRSRRGCLLPCHSWDMLIEKLRNESSTVALIYCGAAGVPTAAASAHRCSCRFYTTPTFWNGSSLLFPYMIPYPNCPKSFKFHHENHFYFKVTGKQIKLYNFPIPYFKKYRFKYYVVTGEEFWQWIGFAILQETITFLQTNKKYRYGKKKHKLITMNNTTIFLCHSLH